MHAAPPAGLQEVWCCRLQDCAGSCVCCACCMQHVPGSLCAAVEVAGQQQLLLVCHELCPQAGV
jgi:hypothetical protein